MSVKSQSAIKQQFNIIPMPQKIVAKTGQFDFKNCKAIVVGTQSLYREALQLQQYLKNIGLNVHMVRNSGHIGNIASIFI
jgi:hypothetical protein